MKVVMPYVGKDLSVNYYKVIGRGGLHTSKTKPHVTVWMKELAEKVKGEGLQLPVTVSVFGKFVDGRCPDLDNLAKVILDAVSIGTGINDKDMRFVALGYSTGWTRPVLEIEIKGRS